MQSSTLKRECETHCRLEQNSTVRWAFGWYNFLTQTVTLRYLVLQILTNQLHGGNRQLYNAKSPSGAFINTGDDWLKEHAGMDRPGCFM